MKFTGHERDFANPAGAGDDLDYMHARFCSPVTGRFLSVDPAGESFDPQTPQSWNQYSYVRGTPLSYSDPSGQELIFFGTSQRYRQLEALVNQGLNGVKLVIDASGKATLQKADSKGPETPSQAMFEKILDSIISDKRSVAIGLVDRSSDIMIGSYFSEAIDLGDIKAVGTGAIVNSSSLLAHEITEQAVKQFQGLASDDYGDYFYAHNAGIVAQNMTSGYTRAPWAKRPDTGKAFSGETSAEFRKGNQRTTVTIVWRNGNVVKVKC